MDIFQIHSQLIDAYRSFTTAGVDTSGLRNNEIAKYGRYRSKEMILEAFDRLSAAGLTVDNPVDAVER